MKVADWKWLYIPVGREWGRWPATTVAKSPVTVAKGNIVLFSGIQDYWYFQISTQVDSWIRRQLIFLTSIASYVANFG